ncbi:MAG: YiiX/YebB-like N1pC/P60 family cysteine hydrolase [Salinisphaeraceae bacterium]|nr:YiiX/YebB-like N1pC/P60 family cysteine hydrolase [Salinisphaeraceae bacterium]
MKWLLRAIGKRLAHFLAKPRESAQQFGTSSPELVAATLRKGDVLLVEGTSRFASAIKYITQSSWSHAALYVGDSMGPAPEGEEPLVLIEADVEEGVRALPLSNYANWHVRICRPVGLTDEQIDNVVSYAVQRLGHQYDLKNIIDLMRYLFRTPPVPTRYRRRMLALGSGDPTRAICSSLIAQAFQSVRYPILPERYLRPCQNENEEEMHEEVMRIRHHSLFAPRDFDISPYFDIVKPMIKDGFHPNRLRWDDDYHYVTTPLVSALADSADNSPTAAND